MFFKKSNQPKQKSKQIVHLVDTTYQLPMHTNMIVVNDIEHAKIFIEGYAREKGFKNTYHLNPTNDYFILDSWETGVYKKNDLVIYEPECYIIDKHAVLMSNKVCNSKRLRELPKHQIVLTYTSKMVHNLSEGMAALRNRYQKLIPHGVTSLNLINKDHLLLLLVNDYN